MNTLFGSKQESEYTNDSKNYEDMVAIYKYSSERMGLKNDFLKHATTPSGFTDFCVNKGCYTIIYEKSFKTIDVLTFLTIYEELFQNLYELQEDYHLIKNVSLRIGLELSITNDTIGGWNYACWIIAKPLEYNWDDVDYIHIDRFLGKNH